MGANFWASLAADAVLAVHFAFVAFVALGFLAIWVGGMRKRPFARNLRFRALHLAAMGIVLLESVFGIGCPLTSWEKQLRQAAGQSAYEESFMQRWIHEILFFDLPPAVFTAFYALFFIGILLSWILIRPERRVRHRRRSEPQ